MTQKSSIAAAVESWLLERPVWAFYPSSARDLKPLTYLHPDHLGSITDRDVPSPNVLVYSDSKREYLDDASEKHWSRPLAFDDQHTTVSGEPVESVTIEGVRIAINRLTYRSDRYTERRYVVLRALGSNQEVSVRAARQGWSPDFLITVCDGCLGFGGANSIEERCEAAVLSSPPLLSGLGPGFRWLVTDHFDVNAREPRAPNVGEAGPFDLEEVALLSTDWSGPGAQPLGGATLFELRLRTVGA